MVAISTAASAPSAPRWDGRRVLFDVVDGTQVVSCAISRGALEELSGRRQSAGTGLLVCFDAARERIEAIALAKHRAHSDRAADVLNIFADDVDDAEIGAESEEPAQAPVQPARA